MQMDKVAEGKRGGVLCVGAVMADVLCRVPRLPERGEGVVVTERTMRLGGCAFNSGNAVRQLGMPCFLLAPLGQGPFAGFIRSELTGRNLGALEVETTLDCGTCTCLVEPDGERTMITSPGIERCFDPEWFDRLDTEGYVAGLASGYEVEGAGGDAIIGFFAAHPELDFYYGPGPRIMGVGEAKHARINALRPIWHLNELEALQFTGASTADEAGRAIALMCGNACVLTRSEAGASVFFADGSRIDEPTDPVCVVDTVGAGDTHLGALAAARAACLPWSDALAIANRLAGAVCGVEGGTLSDSQFASLGLSLWLAS